MKAVAILVVLLMACASNAEGFKFRKEVRATTVTLRTYNAEGNETGTGTGNIAKIEKDGTTWILTAAHVTAGCCKVKTYESVLDDKKEVVTEIFCEADIIRESVDDDLALLRLRKKNHGKTVVFGDHKKVDIDTDVAVCGCFSRAHEKVISEGKVQGFNTPGLNKNTKYHMALMTSYRGCSGGGMYDMDGKYIGMLIAVRGNGIGYYTPIETIKAWAKREKVDFIFDPKASKVKYEPLERQGR